MRKHRSQLENKLGSSPTTSRTSLPVWTRRAREWSTAMTQLATPRGEDQGTCWLKRWWALIDQVWVQSRRQCSLPAAATSRQPGLESKHLVPSLDQSSSGWPEEYGGCRQDSHERGESKSFEIVPRSVEQPECTLLPILGDQYHPRCFHLCCWAWDPHWWWDLLEGDFLNHIRSVFTISSCAGDY